MGLRTSSSPKTPGGQGTRMCAPNGSSAARLPGSAPGCVQAESLPLAVPKGGPPSRPGARPQPAQGHPGEGRGHLAAVLPPAPTQTEGQVPAQGVTGHRGSFSSGPASSWAAGRGPRGPCSACQCREPVNASTVKGSSRCADTPDASHPVHRELFSAPLTAFAGRPSVGAPIMPAGGAWHPARGAQQGEGSRRAVGEAEPTGQGRCAGQQRGP